MKITGKLPDIEVFKRIAIEAKQSKYFIPIAKMAVDILYKRVKDGYGVDNDNSNNPKKVRLKALSKSYKDFRGGKIAFATRKMAGKKWVYSYEPTHAPKLGSFGTPGKSNLTLSGEMLDSIDYKMQPDGFKLYIPNTGSGKVSNKEKAEYVRVSRPFFALTDSEMKILKKEYTAIVRDIVTKLLTRRE